MAPVRNTRKSRKAAKPDTPPRPPNAWILYRTERVKILKAQHTGPPMKQAYISGIVGHMWRQEPDEVKRKYEKQAEIAKAKHAEKYPGYKYKP
ncbi:hypothetical protein OH77DRAFT_1401665, partial [Trametes cingulata]